MFLIALKVDVDTFRGTKEGVPTLIRLLRQYQAGATFLFSMGPDNTGRALKRVFRPGFFSKVKRTSVLEHYGLKTLLYGTLLTAPDIGRDAADEMRSARDAGFECGIHAWDHVDWQDNVRTADVEWTRNRIRQACDRFIDIFQDAPGTHGAAGWQMNEHAFEIESAYGFRYASDGRVALTETGALASVKAGPHYLKVGNRTLSCIQMPTTLPTLDELIGRRIGSIEITPDIVADHLLGLTRTGRDHVFTLHAELEGQKLAPVFESLLKGWKEQGYLCISLADYYGKIKHEPLPTRKMQWGEIPGRSGSLIVS